ncbi:MAG: sodium:calcium antiporter [Chloroflexi bacterium]|nr:sodium:calcium antiporter [Chloroflexota bacterium]
MNRRNPLLIALAFLGTAPAVALSVGRLGFDLHVSDGTASVLYGIGILSAAFLLTWAAEAAEHDISHALSLSFIAIIAVLPEYAVDFTLTWKAGSDPTYTHYAIANMTGANRILIGVAWPLVVFILWARHRIWGIHLHKNQFVDLGFLAVATAYAMTIPLKGRIDLIDAVVLIGLFAVYMWINAKAEVKEPELIGPAQLIGALSVTKRRVTVVGLLVFSAAVIFASAEPFAEGMIRSGKSLGLDEFLLIQWVAPLASEAPEILVACIFAFRGDGVSALALLVSAKVNQWTLLIGSLPVVYSASVGGVDALPLDGRQTEEVFLTAAQSLFAIILMAALFLKPRGAIVLAVLFAAQRAFPQTSVRLAFAWGYLALSAVVLVFDGKRRTAFVLLPYRLLQAAGIVKGWDRVVSPEADVANRGPAPG